MRCSLVDLNFWIDIVIFVSFFFYCLYLIDFFWSIFIFFDIFLSLFWTVLIYAQKHLAISPIFFQIGVMSCLGIHCFFNWPNYLLVLLLLLLLLYQYHPWLFFCRFLIFLCYFITLPVNYHHVPFFVPFTCIFVIFDLIESFEDYFFIKGFRF